MRYAELLCRTHYSFLKGASRPGELVERAAELGLHALAITDLNGVYGMPKAYRAAKKIPGFRLIVGAEVTFDDRPRLVLIAKNRAAYGLMCRILSASHRDSEKADPKLRWNEFLELMAKPEAQGLFAIPRDPKTGAYPTALQNEFLHPEHDYAKLKELFADRLLIPLSRFLDGHDPIRTQRALDLSRRWDARLIATNDVHYHAPSRRLLQDVIAAIDQGTTLPKAGTKLFSNSERYLKSPAQMHALFRDLPEALENTLWVADQCTFCPSELRYRYPSEWIPEGETAQSYLSRLTWQGADRRYPEGIPADVRKQLEHELKLVSELGFADYFLTIWEIVEFAKERKILCQGRGSAANSAVCFCLGITAVDPVRMNLLFERFISAERGEPPDIDVDFEHERREEVIQHIYRRYGRDRAGMVAAVITYRNRLAIREVSKALEVPLEEAKEHAVAAQLADEIYGFPRHLSIHSGGFTLSADPLIEIVPIEPARMEGRTIVQWDKDDLDALGLLKVDVLALGMLSAVRKTLDLTGLKTLTAIPPEDPKTYEMIRRADTVGTFQIESRAQMSMLPRLLPRTFYDLVVQVAIVRPGPIQGKMVHPYLRRRRGEERVDYPHPALKPILGKTLGVPLFQEQVMKMAIELAGFTPGEADELRRAIGAWRSSGAIEKMGRKLMDGLLASGLPQEFVDRIFLQIQGFAEYGFPESHAASFALIAYASSYLKCHHPAEFACALINSQPMGFYSVHTLVDDAKRHGVRVLPVSPHRSNWDCEMENGALRLGFRVVHGMPESHAERLIEERGRRPFASLYDFFTRSGLNKKALETLCMGDAFRCFGVDQRSALWELIAYHLSTQRETTGQLSLFSESMVSPYGGAMSAAQPVLFAPLNEYQAIQSDYSSYGLSLRGHPMSAIRKMSARIPKTTSSQAKMSPNGRAIRIAGLVIVRQRPPTANGVTFCTLEDEHGFMDLILHADVYEKTREIFSAHAFLDVQGVLQRDGQSISLIVKGLRPLFSDDADDAARDELKFASHDYY